LTKCRNYIYYRNIVQTTNHLDNSQKSSDVPPTGPNPFQQKGPLIAGGAILLLIAVAVVAATQSTHPTPIAEKLVARPKPTPIELRKSVAGKLSISASDRTIGMVTSVGPTGLTVTDNNNNNKPQSFTFSSSTIAVRRVPLQTTPDPKTGEVPLIEQQLAVSSIQVGNEVDVSWQKVKGNQNALFIVVMQ